MKKRILSLLLVFAMVFSLIPSTALAVADTQGASAEQANPFADVRKQTGSMTLCSTRVSMDFSAAPAKRPLNPTEP